MPPGRGMPWHAALGLAVLSGAITTAQHDAIRRGLGEPPAPRAAPEVRLRTRGEALSTSAEAKTPGTSAEAKIPPVPGTTPHARHGRRRRSSSSPLRDTIRRSSWRARRAIRDILDPEGAEA
jgi:hypothetical protein